MKRGALRGAGPVSSMRSAGMSAAVPGGRFLHEGYAVRDVGMQW